MLHWIQYIRGYVAVKVWGYSVERLLNLCGNHDILVWDIEDHGDYHTMRMSITGFFALKPLLKKTGTRAAVLHRYGLPFFVSKMQKRKLFVAGLFFCILFWSLASRCIWDIRIEALEQALRKDYDLITWTSLQLQGTTLLVRIKENEMPVYDEQKSVSAVRGMDLVAERDGIVTYIITRSGVPLVSCGDSVKAGDVLVSGAIPVYNEDTTVRRYQYVEADADILLCYTEQVSLEASVAYEEKCYTGEKIDIPVLGAGSKEITLRLFGIPYDLYDTSEEKKQVKLLDHLYLPLFYGQKTVQEYEIEAKRHTDEEMKTLLEEEWRKNISTLLEKGVQITEKNVTIKKNDEKWVLYANMQLEESAVKLLPTEAKPVEATEEETQTDQTRAVILKGGAWERLQSV